MVTINGLPVLRESRHELEMLMLTRVVGSFLILWGLRSLKKVMRMSVSARSFSWPENEYDNEYERSE